MDASGAMYAAHRSENCVTVYASNANGDDPPIRTRKGRLSELHGPYGIAIR